MRNDAGYDVVVIGAGAAGLFAASEAASAGARTLLIEKNRKPGIKILASGGTRCNVTSTLPIRELGLWFGKKAERFLRFGLHELGPTDVRELLAEEGVETAEFPLEKVFPKSGRAADVLRALLARLERSGAELSLEEPVTELSPTSDGFIVGTTARELHATSVIVTVGGQSYPKTGTTGDGYPWLKALGHTIVPPRPGLVPLVFREPWVRDLTGIAVEDVVVSAVEHDGRVVFSRRRPLLFTHRGLSGPGPMDVSSRLDTESGKRNVRIDWLPDRRPEDLDALFRKAQARRQLIASVMPGEFPRRLILSLMSVAGLPEEKSTSDLSKMERRALVGVLKGTTLTPAGTEGFAKAEVTAGGVSLDEVRGKTMESKLVPGLFIAGEVLDLDGPIGGFNFQSAFSTGLVAGRAAAASASRND